MDSGRGDLHDLGWLIKNARETAGLSHRQLGERIGRGSAWVEQLEHGDVASPDAAALARATAVLNLEPVEVDWLSGGALEVSFRPPRTSEGPWA